MPSATAGDAWLASSRSLTASTSHFGTARRRDGAAAGGPPFQPLHIHLLAGRQLPAIQNPRIVEAVEVVANDHRRRKPLRPAGLPPLPVSLGPVAAARRSQRDPGPAPAAVAIEYAAAAAANHHRG